MTRRLQVNCPRTALFGLFAGLLAWELLCPGFIGLADNGDFGKVSAYLDLAAERNTNFVYVQPVYVRSHRNFWNSPYHSSETALAWTALQLSGAGHEDGRFDIRWLGALHAALCAAAFAFLLRCLRGAAIWAAVPALIFTDVCYAAYLNTFYMDAAALCGLLLMAGIAVWMVVTETNRTAAILMFTAASLLFVLSKAQHAVWMMLPAAFLATRRRTAGWVAAAVLTLAGLGLLATSDKAYRGQAMFNVLFYRIAPEGAAARQELIGMGVRPEELRYAGMHSYMDGAPTADRQWTEEFYRRTGFLRLIGWYARHPALTLRYLGETLSVGAPEMRPVNLGNYPEGRGRAAGEHTSRLAWWSTMRSAWLRWWPWHIVVWWALFFAGCAIAMRRGSGAVRGLAGVAAGTGVLALGEFCGAALGDSLDPGRHLFLFQVCTEISVCFGVAGAIHYARMRHKP